MLFVRRAAIHSACRSPVVRTLSHRYTGIKALSFRAPQEPVVIGEEVDVECTAVAFGGRGVCKFPGGFVILCERAVPGEKVHARITAIKKGGRYAEAVKIQRLRPTPYHVNAPCPHFDRCGGCTWLDVAYDQQLAFKRDQVVDVMTRIARINDADRIVNAISPSQQRLRYRNKMEFAFAQVGDNSSGRPAFGLRPAGDHTGLVEVFTSGCVLQQVVADKVLARCAAHLHAMADVSALLPVFNRRTGCGVLRSLTLRTAPLAGRCSGETAVMVIIAAALDRQGKETKKAFAALAADLATIDCVQSVVHERVGDNNENQITVLHGPATISITLRGVVFALSVKSFFQTNTKQAEILVESVEEACALTGENTETILDLFCGVGTFGLCLASKARHVYGCEIVPEAVEDAKRNAVANRIENATFWQADLAQLSESMLCADSKSMSKSIVFGKDVVRPDVVIVDPARSGMDVTLVAILRSLGIPRIVYVSCNPATQARDVALLCDVSDNTQSGDLLAKYRLISCIPVDLFPHTPHVENIVVLERVPSTRGYEVYS
ncbi:uncharacterized protein MICPUCDRAFT_31857 [Micromonas pusilla CCMP1545]|uniref:Predicted protein n=1 Tax=Micromonas pusilla (strain CCMP1545) TaxID=564608 RepID=C1MLF0_MICPC|nr:uncharacterized protein MICPUCDRAFT_31857 [Micromonas pusilla CCMP1545]EEH59531.1 predicted protein [Micromonas pusilla CCMP1545]|eukprot:XP_003056155.1 predicted protein [Micromonas pusilla CCMP1545]